MARMISQAAVSTLKMENQRKSKLFILYFLSFFIVLLTGYLIFTDKFNTYLLLFSVFLFSVTVYYIIVLSKRADDARIGAKAEEYLSSFLDRNLPSTYWIINDLKIKYGNIDCLVIDTIKNCLFLIEIKSSRRFNSSSLSKWIKQSKLNEMILKRIIKEKIGFEVPVFTIISLPFLKDEEHYYFFEDSKVWLLGNRKLIEFINKVEKNNVKVDWFRFIDDICSK